MLALVASATAASPACTAVNAGQLNYNGPSPAAQLGVVLGTFYPGDQLFMTYTSNTPKAGVVLDLILTSISVNTVVTAASGTTQSLTATVGALLPIGAQAGIVDATATLNPRNVVLTVTCNPAAAPTTLAVASTINPTVFGQPGTLTATTTSVGGTPNGDVVFTIDGTAQPAVALINGVATMSTAGLNAGNHAVSASYAGNAGFTVANGTLSGGQTVNKAATTTALTTSSASAAFGSGISMTATTAATAPGSGIPAGSMIFTLDGVDQAPIALSGGSATLSTSALAVGSHTVAARYVATANFLASSATLAGGQVVTKASTSTTLTQSVASVAYGEGATFRATVASAAGTPAGSVVFSIDGVAQSPIALAGGVAEFSTTTLAVGTHTVSALYSGSSSMAASSGSLSPAHTVVPIATTTTLTGPGPIAFGNAATITATVGAASGTPTGSIIFTVDGAVHAPVALVGATATLTLAAPLAGTHTVSASYGGSATHGASSGTLAGGQVVTKAVTTTVLGSLATVTLGQSVNLAATVSSAGGTPDGSVVFTIDGVDQVPVTLAGGRATLLVAGLSVGSHAISAAYSGADNFATSTGTTTAIVNKAATNLLVNSNANPAVSGQGMIFTATVTSPAGTPAGTVVFTLEGVDQPTQTLVNGTASLSLPALPVGTHSVVASYGGNANMLASTASLPGGQIVDRATTTVTLSSDSIAVPFGAAVRFQASVAPVAPGAGTPSGTVVFSVDGVSQGPVPLSGGVASLDLANLTVGAHGVTALYVGDTAFAPSNGTLAGGQAVAKATTVASVGYAPANPVFGDAATLTATISSANGVPTGSVIFTVGGVDRAPIAIVNGVAQLVLPALAVGDLAIGARFAGSSNYLPSAATGTTITVGVAATTTTVTASASATRLGEPLALSAAVVAPHGVPAGFVEFRADGVLLGTAPLNAGAASLSTTALTRGDHAITAHYLGSTDHGPSTGALADPVAVAAGTTALAVTATPQPARFGDTIILTATATAIAGIPSGSLIFTIDGVAQPAVALAGGTASLAVPALEPGIHTVSASYSGSSDHAPVIAALPGGIAIDPANATLTLGASPASPVYGDAITINATLASGAGVPAGDVVFTIDGVAQMPVSPIGGVASITLTGLAAGAHSIAAHFAGDTKFAPIDANLAGGVTVAAAATAMTLAATPDPARFGVPVTFGATVTTAAGVPSGQVAFTIDGIPQTPVALAGGVAQFTTAGLTVGVHTIAASYAAQGNFGTSSAALATGFDVDVSTTQTSLAAPSGTVGVGDTVQFVATVTSASGTPSGAVVFTIDGLDQTPVALVNGTAMLNQIFQAAGNHSVQASFTGSASFGPSSDSLATGVTVTRAATLTSLTAPASGTFGAPLTVSAAVSSTAGTPSGSVTFLVDGSPVGSAMLVNGTATLVLPPLPTGAHQITATYPGNANFTASTAPDANLAIARAASSVLVTVDALSVTAGEPVTIIVNAASQDGPATGSVTIHVDGVDHVVPLHNGIAALTLSTLGAGTYPVTAVYAGNADFSASTGTLVPDLTVGPAPTDINLAASLPRSVAGETYAGQFTAFGGVGPYGFSVSTGNLPPGLALDAATGALTGTPNAAGSYVWDIAATGTAGAPGVYHAQLTVLAPANLVLPANVANAVYGETYTVALTASGGTAPYAYAIAAGSLPQGLIVDAATGAITGAPTQLGQATFTLAVTDANGFAASRSYTLDVTPPTVVVTGAFGTATVGVPFAVAVSAAGGTAPYVFSADAPLPAGLVLNTATGTLAGTPTLAGHYDFGIVATDSNGFGGRLNVALEIDVQPVVVLPTNLAALRQYRPYSQALTATGGTGPFTYAITSGSLPAGITLNPTTGRLSGMPTVGGSYPIDITATDANGLAGLRSYTLDVQPAATLVVNATLAPATAGVPYSQTIAVSGGVAPYHFTTVSGSLPSGIVLDPTTGTLSGTTLLPGSYGLVLDIADAGGDTVTASVALQIVPPTITVLATLADANFGATLTGSVSATGGTAPYGYGVTAGGLPPGILLDPATGDLTGTATAAGTFHAVIGVTDSHGFTGTDALDVTIIAPALTLGTLPAQLLRGRAVSATIAVSGGRAPYSWTTSGNLPAGLALDPATGALTGIPTAIGLRHFTVTATDADGFAASNAYTLEIVTDIGTATLPASLTAATAGVPYAASVAATGGAAPLSYAVTGGTLPAGLALDPATGDIAGTTLQTGDVTIEVTATGADSRTNTQIYVLHVTAPVLAAVNGLPDAVGGTSYAQSLSATGGTAPYGFVLKSGTLPQGLALSPAGLVSGRPTQAGTFPFVVTVTDHNGFDADLAYGVTVTEPSIAVTGTLPSARIGLAYSAAVSATGGTAPYTYAITSGTLPDGITLDAVTGDLTGTPTAPGLASFTITATDADGFADAASFDLLVRTNAGTATMPGTIATPVIGQAYSQSVAASGGTAPYIYSISAGSLPPSLSLGAGGTITGLPLTPGNYSFDVSAVDAAGLVNHQTYGVTIAAPVIDIDVTPHPAQVGTPYWLPTTVVGGVAPYVYDMEDPPPGIDIDPATGIISGMPTTPGTHYFTVLVTDTHGFRTAQRFAMVVAAAPVTLDLPLSLPDGTENAAYNASLVPSNAVGAVTYSLANGSQLPAGLLLDSAGIISGTPATPGTYGFSVHAEDADGNVGDASYALTIAAAPSATAAVTTAVLTSSAASVVVGEAFVIDVGVTTAGGFADEGAIAIFDQVSGLTIVSGALAADGTASFSVAFGDTANRVLVARYAGTPRFAPIDSGGVALTVASAQTSLVLSGAVASVPAGTPIMLVANATRRAPATGAAGPGTVHFYVDSIEQSVQPATSGAAAYMLTMPPGQHRIRAAFVPAGSDDIGSDDEHDVLVTSGTTTILAGATGTVPEDQNLIYTATVIPAELGVPLSGTVTFSDNGQIVATVPLAGSSATHTFVAPARGLHAITAVFGGDTIYGASSAQQATANVVALPTTHLASTTTLSADDAAPQIGQPVTLTATVVGDGIIAPTGTVTFADANSGVVLGMATLDGNGLGALTIALTDAMPTTIVGTYSGDAFLLPSTGSASLTPVVAATITALSLDFAQVLPQGTVRLSANVQRRFGGLPGAGTIAFLADGIAFAHVPTNGSAPVTAISDPLSASTVFTARFIPGPSSEDAPSLSTPVIVDIIRTVPQGTLSLALSADSQALFTVGQSITVTAVVTSSGGPATQVHLISGLPFDCPRTTLEAGTSMTCKANYSVTAADLSAGQVTFAATAEAADAASVTAQLVLRSAAESVAKTFAALTDDFVADRARVLGNAITLPNILTRRHLGSRAGTVQASHDETSQTLGFSTSLAELRNFAAVQAADDMALDLLEEPMPFNIWMDARYSVHAAGEDHSRWGSLGTIAIGADYLVTKDVLAGLILQGDWATEVSEKGTVEGTGFLLGPYVSIALDEHLSFDASVLYGRSSNTAAATLFGNAFAGDFDTSRLYAKGALTGFFEVDKLTLRPSLSFGLTTESLGAYTVSNADADTVSVPGSDHGQLRLTLGGTAEYNFTFDNGMTLRPTLGIDFGFTRDLDQKAADAVAFVGSLTAGLQFETVAGFLLGLDLTTQFNSDHFVATGFRASIKGHF